MTQTLLSIGHGYSAQALAHRLRARGWTVIGTTRCQAKAERLRADGVEALIWPGTPLPLKRATHVLTSVAPEAGGDPVLATESRALAAAAGHLRWVGYLSTTGVYGDHGGAWVDEDAPLMPATARGRARVSAETGWRALAARCGLALHIFRLAGIYGPGRGPFQKLRTGRVRAVIKPGQVFSRIHVDDIAAVLEASMDRPAPGAIYNVGDDEPAPPQDVLDHAAMLLGLAQPQRVDFAQADMSPAARDFYAESKRVRNSRIRQQLGVQLAWPDYRCGLQAVLDAERGAGPG